MVTDIWLNDLNPNIIGLFYSFRNEIQFDNLLKSINEVHVVNKEEFYNWKEVTPKGDVDRALKVLIKHNCSFSGLGGGYSKAKASRNWTKSKSMIWNEISKIFRKSTITSFDYSFVLYDLKYKSKPGDFLYLDPPYYLDAEKHDFYGKGYNKIEWDKMFKILSELKVNWLVSSSHHREIIEIGEKWIPNLHFRAYQTSNSINGSGEYNELLLSNYPLI